MPDDTSKRPVIRLISLTILVLLAGWAGYLWLTITAGPGEFSSATFLNVGQGDSELIETVHGRQVLVDGGPGDQVLQELGEVMGSMDRSLDMVILTHPHDDHVGGLIPVLERYAVDYVVESDQSAETSAIMKKWNQAVADEGAEVVFPQTGLSIDLGDGVTLSFYVPKVDADYEESANHRSLVIQVQEEGECRVLLTGDIDIANEEELIASGLPLSCDVLKAAHHGSKYANTQVFLDAVQPSAVVIPVGAANRYGHPDPGVLDRFSSLPIYRTDLHGRVTVQLSEPVDIGVQGD
ncbi:hypothetical protein AUK40_05160 [Candidatus Wirthbacteria bacterium CG2_30_54_11]|uniref:Metallo-beta-lactamase domain-containing protein n=1 Tax=Candidatus Wirthbacteria bacterium CG2_30_54_11 TaxID=1817892 RepID=A0A1J5IHS5_9BACT|nr:MAG: hypothetical protein AUK40_05160 [Candidatus Wirthbacteria bacterium CG2_30_54_11]